MNVDGHGRQDYQQDYNCNDLISFHLIFSFTFNRQSFRQVTKSETMSNRRNIGDEALACQAHCTPQTLPELISGNGCGILWGK